MIKLEELSLGNWVKFAGKFFKVTQLDKDSEEICLSIEDEFPVITDDVIADIDVDPIPLNDKILEVNGFEKSGNVFSYLTKGGILKLRHIEKKSLYGNFNK